jgi:hypothetical protein
MRASIAFLEVNQIAEQNSPSIHRLQLNAALPFGEPSHSFRSSHFRIHFRNIWLFNARAHTTA